MEITKEEIKEILRKNDTGFLDGPEIIKIIEQANQYVREIVKDEVSAIATRIKDAPDASKELYIDAADNNLHRLHTEIFTQKIRALEACMVFFKKQLSANSLEQAKRTIALAKKKAMN